ncbi:MAG: histidinol dehydrogenase [Gracilibacteraceae bacterium]|jgi:histidinol dehydrogenase|nr:histidinol dehydrogenase [Gracilibacteraceae bacterium]
MKEIVSDADWDLAARRRGTGADRRALADTVAAILAKVADEGDEALYDLTERFDGPDLRGAGLRVTEAEIAQAGGAVSAEWLAALRAARDNIRRYHEKQKRVSWLEPAADGSILGQMTRPLASVGIYVPGGTAAYPSSVLMNAVPAAVAGVERIVMVSPPQRDGRLKAEVLAAARECGVEEIYKIGGAQAIAALAFGAPSVPPVDKITGPGNIYVTLAKKQVYGIVDIDMLAGPSEIVILADETWDAALLAADLLSQAEHDALAAAVCISPHEALLREVAAETERQLTGLPREEIARRAWEDNGALILVDSLARGMDLANAIAPEHLELAVAEPFAWLGRVRNAGAVFLGPCTPEAVGDYFAGPDHILPTGGTARFHSVLDVDAFLKKISVVHYSPEALRASQRQIALLARSEGLEAHARAVERREESRDGE